MSEEKYNLIFLGLSDNLPGTKDKFSNAMSQLFKASGDQIDRIIAKAPVIVAKNLDLEKADLIKTRIESIGGKAQLQGYNEVIQSKNQKMTREKKPQGESGYRVYINKINNESAKHDVASHLSKVTNGNYLLIRKKWLKKLPFKLPGNYSYEEAENIKKRLDEFGSKASIKENKQSYIRIPDINKLIKTKNIIIGLVSLGLILSVLIIHTELWRGEPHLFRAHMDNKWGYIDNKGRIVIIPRFEDAWHFHEGLAPVKINGKWGFIDKKGKIAINPQFDSVSRFKEGTAIVTVSGKEGFLDKTGKTTFNPKFDEILGLFYEGLTRVKINGKWGYADKKGNIIIEPKFDSCSFFSQGLAAIEVGEKVGFIDRKGRMVINAEFERVRGFSEGRAQVKIDGKWGYVDKKGMIVIAPQFDDCSRFLKGLAIATIGGKSGFIDRKGRMVINAEFERVRGFSEGLAAVKIGGKWGFIDKKGRVVISPQFDNPDAKWSFLTNIRALHFKEGLAPVKIGSKWGYIDKNGETVIHPQFDGVGLFSEGLAEVRIDHKRVYINRTGQIVWGNKGLKHLSKPGTATQGSLTKQGGVILWTIIEVVMIAVLLGLIPASIGRSKGRNFVQWWIYGAGLFVVALPHSLLIKVDQAAIEKRQMEEGMKKCPFCAEMIKIEAKICRYCSRELQQI